MLPKKFSVCSSSRTDRKFLRKPNLNEIRVSVTNDCVLNATFYSNISVILVVCKCQDYKANKLRHLDDRLYHLKLHRLHLSSSHGWESKPQVTYVGRYHRITSICGTSVSRIRVITKLPNSEQSYKGKVKTHKYAI